MLRDFMKKTLLGARMGTVYTPGASSLAYYAVSSLNSSSRHGQYVKSSNSYAIPVTASASEEDSEGTSCYYGCYEQRVYIAPFARYHHYLDVIAILIG
jgi:hypothetical protein